MIYKIRENIFIGDYNLKENDLIDNKISIIFDTINSYDFSKDHNLFDLTFKTKNINIFGATLHKDKINKPHVKDIACHIVKYMAQSGENILVIDEDGVSQSIYTVARAICEMENISIYEVFLEIKKIIPEIDLGNVYL